MDSKELIQKYREARLALRPIEDEICREVTRILVSLIVNCRACEHFKSFYIGSPAWELNDESDMIEVDLLNKYDSDCNDRFSIPCSFLGASDEELREFARLYDWDEAIRIDRELSRYKQELLENERKLYERLKAKFEGGNNG